MSNYLNISVLLDCSLIVQLIWLCCTNSHRRRHCKVAGIFNMHLLTTIHLFPMSHGRYTEATFHWIKVHLSIFPTWQQSTTHSTYFTVKYVLLSLTHNNCLTTIIIIIFIRTFYWEEPCGLIILIPHQGKIQAPKCYWNLDTCSPTNLKNSWGVLRNSSEVLKNFVYKLGNRSTLSKVC